MDMYGAIVMVVLLGVGAAAGFLMHRSDFCMAGAFRDLFLFKSAKLLRPLLLLVVASATCFELARLAGLLPHYPFPWFSPPSITNLIGGVVFGLGMALSGGCVVGVLYKLGAGSLLAGVAVVGLMVGSALYAEVHPWWSSFARQVAFTVDAVTLPQMLSVSPTPVVILLAGLGGAFCLKWRKAGLWHTHNKVEGFIPYWVTACCLSVLGLLTVLISGVPMGVATTYAKGAALFESWVVPQHLAGVAFFQGQPARHALPLDEVMRVGGKGPFFDVITLLQVPLIVGILLGAAFSAALLGELRPVWRVPARQVFMVFCGGVIMALGSRMTPGCNVWHLWGGLPLLTLQSVLFTVGLFPGAWLGGKVVKGILMRGVAIAG